MKLTQIHVHYAPSRDRILLVHRAPGLKKHETFPVLDATLPATMAFSGWILREPWEGANKLPALIGFLWKVWGRLAKPKGGVKTQQAYRDMLQPNGQRLRFSVEVFEGCAEGFDAPESEEEE